MTNTIFFYYIIFKSIEPKFNFVGIVIIHVFSALKGRYITAQGGSPVF